MNSVPAEKSSSTAYCHVNEKVVFVDRCSTAYCHVNEKAMFVDTCACRKFFVLSLKVDQEQSLLEKKTKLSLLFIGSWRGEAFVSPYW